MFIRKYSDVVIAGDISFNFFFNLIWKLGQLQSVAPPDINIQLYPIDQNRLCSLLLVAVVFQPHQTRLVSYTAKSSQMRDEEITKLPNVLLQFELIPYNSTCTFFYLQLIQKFILNILYKNEALKRSTCGVYRTKFQKLPKYTHFYD